MPHLAAAHHVQPQGGTWIHVQLSVPLPAETSRVVEAGGDPRRGRTCDTAGLETAMLAASPGWPHPRCRHQTVCCVTTEPGLHSSRSPRRLAHPAPGVHEHGHLWRAAVCRYDLGCQLNAMQLMRRCFLCIRDTCLMHGVGLWIGIAGQGGGSARAAVWRVRRT